MPKHTIDDLRAHLFATLEGLHSGNMDIERARAVADIAQVVVNSARVEVDHVRATQAAGGSAFFATPAPQLEHRDGVAGRVITHRLKG